MVPRGQPLYLSRRAPDRHYSKAICPNRSRHTSHSSRLMRRTEGAAKSYRAPDRHPPRPIGARASVMSASRICLISLLSNSSSIDPIRLLDRKLQSCLVGVSFGRTATGSQSNKTPESISASARSCSFLTDEHCCPRCSRLPRSEFSPTREIAFESSDTKTAASAGSLI